MVSLDGYIEGANQELDWHIVDSDFLNYAEQTLNSVDCILFGRKTYEMMAAYWPLPEQVKNDPVIAAKMNNLPKIIFSKTLDKVEWKNSTLVKGNIKETILKLKEQSGKDIVILGSGSIVSALMQLGLIDEYRAIISPVILGGGKPQFTGDLDRKTLKLTDLKRLSSGVVILYYQPIN
jgi:dihydrofolate reductase